MILKDRVHFPLHSVYVLAVTADDWGKQLIPLCRQFSARHFVHKGKAVLYIDTYSTYDTGNNLFSDFAAHIVIKKYRLLSYLHKHIPNAETAEIRVRYPGKTFRKEFFEDENLIRDRILSSELSQSWKKIFQELDRTAGEWYRSTAGNALTAKDYTCLHCGKPLKPDGSLDIPWAACVLNEGENILPLLLSGLYFDYNEYTHPKAYWISRLEYHYGRYRSRKEYARTLWELAYKSGTFRFIYPEACPACLSITAFIRPVTNGIAGKLIKEDVPNHEKIAKLIPSLRSIIFGKQSTLRTRCCTLVDTDADTTLLQIDKKIIIKGEDLPFLEDFPVKEIDPVHSLEHLPHRLARCFIPDQIHTRGLSRKMPGSFGYPKNTASWASELQLPVRAIFELGKRTGICSKHQLKETSEQELKALLGEGPVLEAVLDERFRIVPYL